MPSKGRPRSEEARAAVLGAAAELLREDGYEGLTIGGIAERAGVGRQTVYRWWSSKSAIVGEAVMAGVIGLPAPPGADNQQEPDAAVPELGEWLTQLGETLAEADTGSVVRALAAAAAEGGPEAEQIYARYTFPVRQSIVRIAVAGGSTEHDAGVLADAIQGALLLRALTRQPVDAGYLAALGRLGAGAP